MSDVLSKQDIDKRLEEIARAYSVAKSLQPTKQSLLQSLAELEAIEEKPKLLREQLRVDVEVTFNATGNYTLHDLVTVKRTSQYRYDANEALTYCKDNNLDDYIVVSEQLDKRKFKAVADELGFVGGETVNEIQIALPQVDKLGHLLIVGVEDDE